MIVEPDIDFTADENLAPEYNKTGNPPPKTETVGTPENKLLHVATGNVMQVIAPFLNVHVHVAYPDPLKTIVAQFCGW